MKKTIAFIRNIAKSKTFVGSVITGALTLSSHAQTADPNVVEFTSSLTTKAGAIAEGLPAAGLAGLGLFAVWYGISAVMRTFKTVA